MFIQIDNVRIKLSTIKEYRPCRQTVDTKRWYLELKGNNNARVFYFDTKKELDTCITVLDTLLKVTSTNVI